MSGTPFADVADLPEDERIRLIGEMAQSGTVVGFIVEDDAKASRYVTKLTTRFRVREIDRRDWPLQGKTVTVRIGPKES